GRWRAGVRAPSAPTARANSATTAATATWSRTSPASAPALAVAPTAKTGNRTPGGCQDHATETSIATAAAAVRASATAQGPAACSASAVPDATAATSTTAADDCIAARERWAFARPYSAVNAPKVAGRARSTRSTDQSSSRGTPNVTAARSATHGVAPLCPNSVSDRQAGGWGRSDGTVRG